MAFLIHLSVEPIGHHSCFSIYKQTCCHVTILSLDKDLLNSRLDANDVIPDNVPRRTSFEKTTEKFPWLHKHDSVGDSMH